MYADATGAGLGRITLGPQENVFQAELAPGGISTFFFIGRHALNA
jgi:hypothetical protein